MLRTLLVVLGLALIVGTGGTVYWQKTVSLKSFSNNAANDSAESTNVNSSSNQNRDDDNESEDEDETEDDDDNVGTTPSPTPSTGGFTMAEVAAHNSAQSCWSTINGNVYDLTSWIPNHPGGPDKIIRLCGTDGSAKFNAQHGGSPKPETTLAGFKIGELKQ